MNNIELIDKTKSGRKGPVINSGRINIKEADKRLSILLFNI